MAHGAKKALIPVLKSKSRLQEKKGGGKKKSKRVWRMVGPKQIIRGREGE